MKYCAACEDMFEPKVSKIEKYCSADCAYDHGSIQTIECPICDDTFDPKFTKTFESCGCVKTEAYIN
jgi:hypothetical protein